MVGDRAVLLRYDEIALKGDNRFWFEKKLASNARKVIRQNADLEVEATLTHGRIILDVDWNEKISDCLSKVFGIANYSPMKIVTTDIQVLTDMALQEFKIYLESHPMPKTFRVRTRRSEKALPMTSNEIDMIVGSNIKEKFPELIVNLSDAEMTVGIELRHKRSYIWTQKVQGPGGLPVGSNGHLLCLMSGGLDSPIAAIQVLKRGALASFVHFYGAPFVGPEVLEKVEDLVRLVNRFQPDARPLHVIPFGKIQERIALATQPKLRTILYRRMMIRISEALAVRMKASALVTGESLGQVASQTVENMATVNSVAKMPILRPLVTYDKNEIIQKAHQWGTFATAVRPGVDCCTLFADRHPSLRASNEDVEEQEAKFPVQELVELALSGLEIREL